MKQPPFTVRLSLALIGITAVFWLGFGLLVALGGIRSLADLGLLRWVMSALALGAGICLAGLAYLLWKRLRFAYPAGVVLLTIVAVLSVTDDIGLPDLISLLVALAALVLLLKDRKWYLRKDRSAG